MKPSVKLALILFAILLVASIFNNRYLSPLAGVNSAVGDYSAHLNISEHLHNHDLFPAFNQDSIGDHATSKYLPIYHGLLGFHTISFAMEYLGMPRPGAYALINDISLIIVTIIFIFLLLDCRKSKNSIDLLLAIFLFFPVYFSYFTKSVNAGFYSLLLSQSLIAAGVYLFSKDWKKTAWGFFIYAFFSYPDSLIWFIPLCYIAYPRKSLYASLVLLPLWIAMMAVPLSRGPLLGDFVTSLVPWFAVLAYLALFARQIFNRDKKLAVAAGIFIFYSAVLLIFTIRNYNLSYYGVKLSSFSYLLLPYLFITVPVSSTKRGRLFIAITLYFFIASNEIWSPLNQQYFGSHSTFNNRDFKSARLVQMEITKTICTPKSTYVIPAFGTHSNTNSLASYNSLLINYDLYSLELSSQGFKQIMSVSRELETYGQFIRSILQSEVTQWIQTIETRIQEHHPKLDFCLAISKEDSTHFAKSQYFEKLYVGEQFVYFKPKKP